MELLKRVLIAFVSILAAGLGVAIIVGLVYFGAVLGIVLACVSAAALLGFLVYEYIQEGRDLKP